MHFTHPPKKRIAAVTVMDMAATQVNPTKRTPFIALQALQAYGFSVSRVYFFYNQEFGAYAATNRVFGYRKSKIE